MPTFQKVKLGDIATVIMGQSPASEFYNQGGNGLPFFQGVKDFGEKYPTEASWSTVTPRVAEKGDVLFSVRAPVGELNIANKKCCIGRGVAAIRSINNQSDYLYFLLKSHIEKIKSFGNGSVYDAVNKDTLEKIIVDVFPDPKTQTRIASVLSAYDDLIENNEKRIKALEEMAQLLYTEWFVKFKFPGCEKKKTKSRSERSSATGMVDSGTEYGPIPEGWEVKKFGDFFDVKYGKNLPTTKISEFGKYKVYGAGGVIGYYDQKNVDTKTTLVTCRGNGSGTVWRTFGEGFITNNSFTVSSENKEVAFEFIYSCLKGCNISASISGSAQPQVTIESINFVKFVLPPIKLIKSFVEKARKSYELSDKLRQRNETLSKTRDLLIPQLVTGKRELK